MYERVLCKVLPLGFRLKYRDVQSAKQFCLIRPRLLECLSIRLNPKEHRSEGRGENDEIGKHMPRARPRRAVRQEQEHEHGGC